MENTNLQSKERSKAFNSLLARLGVSYWAANGPEEHGDATLVVDGEKLHESLAVLIRSTRVRITDIRKAEAISAGHWAQGGYVVSLYFAPARSDN